MGFSQGYFVLFQSFDIDSGNRETHSLVKRKFLR